MTSKFVDVDTQDVKLLSSGEASKLYRRKGFRHYITSNKIVILAPIFGLACTAAAFCFTYWLSKQLSNCPSWTVNCQVDKRVSYINKHIGLVQGIVSTLYSIGMAAIAYAGYQLGEAALWPILTQRSYRLGDVDKYLSATRGSIVSLPPVIWKAKTGQHMAVLACVAVATLLQQTNNVIVGYVFNKQHVATLYQSNVKYGGGLGLPFNFDPQATIPVGVESASNLYASWSRGLSAEPMPDQRDFLIDRSKLSRMGNMSVNAIKAEKTITCTGWPLEFVEDITSGTHCMAATFEVSRPGNSSATVRLQPEMAVWVNEIVFKTKTRAVSTLVFAALNGSIEGGTTTDATSRMQECNYQSISAVSCDVDVDLIDSFLVVGEGSSPSSNGTVSTLDQLRGPKDTRSPYGPLGDLSAWLGVAVASFGRSIKDTQPMFQFRDPYPVFYTSTFSISGNSDWTLQQLQDLINVCSGAVGMTMMQQWYRANSTIDTVLPTLWLETWRSFLLLLSPFIVVMTVVSLVALDAYMYSITRVPVMRNVSTGEIIRSTQNDEMKEVVQQALAMGSSSDDRLDPVKVKYGVYADGCDGLGAEKDVVSFVGT